MKADKPSNWTFEALEVEALKRDTPQTFGWERIAIGAIVLAAYANAARVLFS